MTPRTIVRGTMLAATMAWAIGEVLKRRSARLDRLSRVVWTLGVALSVVHVVVAFHFVYRWDHEAAVAATVQQSVDRFGVAWRGGIYVNYVFVILWLVDVCWWWTAPGSYQSRPLALERARFLVFLFMFVNGAIVFASGAGRVVGGISVGLALVGYLMPRMGSDPGPIPGVRPQGKMTGVK
jgi:hypothetical protein